MRPSKICPHCGETIHAEASKCRYCGEFLAEPVPRVASPPFAINQPKAHDAKNHTAPIVITVILVSCTVLLFLCFHVSLDCGGVFPKEHLSFADTFINVNDVINRYNNAAVFERIPMRSSYLFRKLHAEGCIVDLN